MHKDTLIHNHNHPHNHNHEHSHCHCDLNSFEGDKLPHPPISSTIYIDNSQNLKNYPFLTHLTPNSSILTVRALSGLSGDILLCWLARMSNTSNEELCELLHAFKITALCDSVSIINKSVNAISGFHAKVTLPHEHAHRNLIDILNLIEKTDFTKNAKNLSINTFTLLAQAEANVHNKSPENVTFHEVGALDSILDICLASALFDKLQPDHFICSPLPLADGSIFCAHGHIPSPAPAVLQLLKNIPVCPFKGQGETITPTAIALLKSFGANFDLWPSMTIQNNAIIYGTKNFANVANGSIWAFGTAHNL